MPWTGYSLRYDTSVALCQSQMIRRYQIAFENFGWTLHDQGVKASILITSNGTNVSNAQTITICGKIYTFKTTLTPTEGEVLIGATAAVSLDNLKLAVNEDAASYNTSHSCAPGLQVYVDATTNTDTTQLIEFKIESYTYPATFTISEALATLSLSAANFSNGKPMVYKSNGSAGTRPYGYLALDWAAAHTIAIYGYGYYNADTHVGTMKAYNPNSAGVVMVNNTHYFIGGNVDYIFTGCAMENNPGWANRKFYGRPTHFVRDVITTTSAQITAGSHVSVPVVSSTGFAEGMYVTIWGNSGEGRDKLYVESVDDATHITVTTILRTYESGAHVGTPAMCFCANIAASQGAQWSDIGHYGGVGTTEPTATNCLYAFPFYIYSVYIAYLDPDPFYNRFPMFPITLMTGDSLLGFIVSDYVYQSGAMTIYDVVAINDDGSLPETGTVDTADSTTITDAAKSWTTNALANRYIVIASGTGVGQARKIASNTGTVITVVTAWVTNPDGTSQYKIMDKVFRCFEHGGAGFTLSNASTLVLETDYELAIT